MSNFEQFKQVWQQQVIPASSVDTAQLKKTNIDTQRKLEQEQIWSAFWLLLTAIVLTGSLRLVWIGFFFGIKFHSILTYVAVILIALLSVTQGFINLSMYIRLRQIDITASLAEHLNQWQQYHAFRKQLVRVNIPLYYLLLNTAFGLYFIEILGLLPLTSRLIALALYIAWVLYAYFVLRRKVLRKEHQRLESIIRNLRIMQVQLRDES